MSILVENGSKIGTMVRYFEWIRRLSTMMPLSLKGYSWFSCTSMPIQWRGGQGKGKGFIQLYLDGGFKYFLFSPLFGEDSHFDYYFSKGLKPPTRYKLYDFPLLLSLRAISYSHGALNIGTFPGCFGFIFFSVFSAGRWRKTRSAGSPRTDESYGVSGAVRVTWGTWVVTDPCGWS